MEGVLIEKVRQRTFLYDTKSPDYRDQHMRANAWEGIGKELKIKRKFYVSSRDVRTVCPRLNATECPYHVPALIEGREWTEFLTQAVTVTSYHSGTPLEVPFVHPR